MAYVNLRIWVGCFSLLLFSCTDRIKHSFNDNEIPHLWTDLTLFITKNTPANTPTFASRCLGYTGLTMYESVVPGFNTYQSLSDQLNAGLFLPKIDTTKEYVWPVSLNAAQAQILRKIYIQTADSNKLKIDSLELIIFKYYTSFHSKEAIERSVHFGKSIADSIFNWSVSDGGHRGYLKNFDKKMVLRQFPGSWKPPLYAQSFSHYPLHPHWGENRTFLKIHMQMDTPSMIRYDTLKSSLYYKQFMDVYTKEKTLTQSEKEAAIWWGDDPDVTFTPPGHSYYLASKIMRHRNVDLITSAMTYARVGMAVADAFINCWKWKYYFFAERPNTYIPEHIDQNWESFWPDPPFPSFPSGHAIQAGAATTVLIDLYGNGISITDSSHYGRKRDVQRNTDFVIRHFDSLTQIANEIANSRFFGGIHTHQDNEVGLAEGKKIGKNINELKWRR